MSNYIEAMTDAPIIQPDEGRVYCPDCHKVVWDVATVDQRLNKCWGCGLRFETEVEEND